MPELDAVLRRLDAVARTLRMVVDEAAPPLSPEPQLARALQQQAAWLLAAPLTVDTGPPGSGLAAAEAAAVVDIAELMLFAMTPGAPPAQARAEVLAADDLIRIRLAVVPAEAEGQTDGGKAAARAALDELARMLTACIGTEFGREAWRSWIALPRALPPGRDRLGTAARHGQEAPPAAAGTLVLND